MTTQGELDGPGAQGPRGLGRNADEMAGLAHPDGAERRRRESTVAEFYGGLVHEVKSPALAARLQALAAQDQGDRIWPGPDAEYDVENRSQPRETEDGARSDLRHDIEVIDRVLQDPTQLENPPRVGLEAASADDRFVAALRHRTDQVLGLNPGESLPLNTSPEDDGRGHIRNRYTTAYPGVGVEVWQETSGTGPDAHVVDTRYNLISLAAESQEAA